MSNALKMILEKLILFILIEYLQGIEISVEITTYVLSAIQHVAAAEDPSYEGLVAHFF